MAEATTKLRRVHAPPRTITHLDKPCLGDVVMWTKPGANRAIPAVINLICGDGLLSLSGLSPDAIHVVSTSQFDAHAVPHEGNLEMRKKRRTGYWNWTERELHLRSMIDLLEDRIAALEDAK